MQTDEARALRRHMIENDLPYLHKQRWNQIAATLHEKLEAATDDTARAEVEKEITAHYATRFHSETSRAALLAELDNRE